jgi:hypothetical protein
MPVMHPVVARDDLTRLDTRQNAALKALQGRIGGAGAHNSAAKIVPRLNRLLDGFRRESWRIVGCHRLRLQISTRYRTPSVYRVSSDKSVDTQVLRDP